MTVQRFAEIDHENGCVWVPDLSAWCPAEAVVSVSAQFAHNGVCVYIATYGGARQLLAARVLHDDPEVAMADARFIALEYAATFRRLRNVIPAEWTAAV